MKNGRIQFWRIIFTYLIIFYHLNNEYKFFTSGYIAVEFFFIVSGFLLASKFERLAANNSLNDYSALNFTLDKYKRFLPHSAYAFCVALVVNGYYYKFTAIDYVKGFFSHLNELLLVDAIGLNMKTTHFYNSVTWYLSVMLIAGYFIWVLMKKSKKMYLELLIPASLIVIYPYFYREYGHLNEHRVTQYLVMNSAFMRGFAAMNIGILAYYCSQKIRDAKWNQKALAIVSDVLFAAAIALSFVFYRTEWDFLILAIIAVAVTLAFSCDWNVLFNNKFIGKWAEITLSIYLNHKIFRSAMKLVWPNRSIVMYIAWFVFITVYSLITYYGINWIIKKISSKKVGLSK